MTFWCASFACEFAWKWLRKNLWLFRTLLEPVLYPWSVHNSSAIGTLSILALYYTACMPQFPGKTVSPADRSLLRFNETFIFLNLILIGSAWNSNFESSKCNPPVIWNHLTSSRSGQTNSVRQLCLWSVWLQPDYSYIRLLYKHFIMQFPSGLTVWIFLNWINFIGLLFIDWASFLVTFFDWLLCIETIIFIVCSSSGLYPADCIQRIISSRFRPNEAISNRHCLSNA